MLPNNPTKSTHAVVMIYASPADLSNALRALANHLDQPAVVREILAQPIVDGKQSGNFMVMGEGGAYASITIVLEA